MVPWIVPGPVLRALFVALATAACASGGADPPPPMPVRASDFRPAQLRQVALSLRVAVSDAAALPQRERDELAARYESALAEALDARAVPVRDIRSSGARGALPSPQAAAARAREVGADHALLVTLTVEPSVVRLCEETRRPLQGRALVWKQEAWIVRAGDGGERQRVTAAVPDVEVECDAARPAPQRRGMAATTAAAVERLVGALLGR